VRLHAGDGHRVASRAHDEEGRHAELCHQVGQSRQRGALEVGSHAPRQSGQAQAQPVVTDGVPFDELVVLQRPQQPVGDRAVQPQRLDDLADGLRRPGGGQVLQDPDAPVQGLRLGCRPVVDRHSPGSSVRRAQRTYRCWASMA
jgi:hypothetical protein